MARSKHYQGGAALIIIVAVLMMFALAMLIGKTGELIAASGKRVSASLETEMTIQNALVSFTSTYQRLPCPADPTGVLNPGWPDGVKPLALPAAAVCLYPTGIVPWNALGLTQAQVTDEWGRMISYRVFDGVFGLTQDMGASALNCSNNILPASAVAPTANGLCDTASLPLRTLHTPATPTFITDLATPYDKGLVVNDFGTVENHVAFVLISHGPSGLGGYMPTGNRMMPLPVAGALDYPNTQSFPSTFSRQAVSNPSFSPGTIGHYDDSVTYVTIAELLRSANQDARSWP